MKSSTSKYVVISLIFCALTIMFFLLYHFQVIDTFNMCAAIVYITYFVGLAIYYNAANLTEQAKGKSAAICVVFSVIFLLISIAFMVYGYINGLIVLW